MSEGRKGNIDFSRRGGVQEVVGKLGQEFRIVQMKPQYPAGLQDLLDRARDLGLFNPNAALLIFGEAVRKCEDCNDLWSQRGVAAALLNSGQILTQLKKYTEAVSMFKRVIERAGSDEELELEAMNAASLLTRVKELQERDGKKRNRER
jgi:tetratricopeptide (TPR) repeat protein